MTAPTDLAFAWSHDYTNNNSRVCLCCIQFSALKCPQDNRIWLLNRNFPLVFKKYMLLHVLLLTLTVPTTLCCPLQNNLNIQYLVAIVDYTQDQLQLPSRPW